jgi:GTPase
VNNRAILVIIERGEEDAGSAQRLLVELARLAASVDLQAAGHLIVRLRESNSRLLIGAGKAQEVEQLAESKDADVIVFDDELSPSQQRNWEKMTGRTVIDRHQVILDIFRKRATTREAALQVELAHMQYHLPRLTRAWTHLSRQQGGARGTRGEGEKQLERDRRAVLRRMHRVREDLAALATRRATLSRKRRDVPVPSAAFVGYTNAGKSSLLRALTGADVLVANKLFCTLDPTTRRMALKGGMELVLTDTVGFVRKLPHDLVNAFHSTLEQAVDADVLIVVLDASDPDVLRHYDTTTAVLKQIGATATPVILAFNKMDRVADAQALQFARARFARSEVIATVEVSSISPGGAEPLQRALERFLADSMRPARYRIPADRHDLTALIHRTGSILEQQYDNDGLTVTARVPDRTWSVLEAYLIVG